MSGNRRWKTEAAQSLRSFLAKSYSSSGGKLISFNRISFPHVATYSAAYRVIGQFKSARFIAEIVLIAKSCTQITLTVFGGYTAKKWVAAESLRLVRTLVRRVQA